MPKVSIIIPVYNACRYLQECVQHVRLQSFQDWELLLINDGSSDGSAELCDQFASTDSRIRVFHKPNTGVSDTRNHGLYIASGEYVIFLDADDYWFDYTFLEKLVSLAEFNHLDIIRGEYKAVNELGEDLFHRDISSDRMNVTYKVIDPVTFIKYAIHGEFFLVLSLFRKSAIGELRLNKKQIFLEDMRFYSLLLQKSLRCMYVPLYFYAYRKNSDSVSFKFNLKKLADSFGMCDFFHECAHRSSSEDLKAYFNYYSVMMYKWTLETVAINGYYEHRVLIVEKLKLDSLHRRVIEWISQDQIDNKKLIFYLSPMNGIRVSRCVSLIKEAVYNLRNKIKFVLTILR